jgi:predicted PurR-regulated permease PerM
MGAAAELGGGEQSDEERARVTAGQLAALIAAVSVAVVAGVGVVVLIKLARLTSALTRLVSSYSGRADQLLERAQAAVDRTHEQLARTDSITASMDQVTANMAELSGHVSAMTGLARALSGAVGAPLTGLSALAYGVRHALIVRRPVPAALLADHTAEGDVRVAGAPRAAIVGSPSRSSRASIRAGGRS